MKIYKDLCTGDADGLFSDAYPVEEVDDGFLLKIEGKFVVRRGDNAQFSIGANPSAEDPAQEQVDDSGQAGIDIILDYKLEDQSAFFDNKKSLLKYLKLWVKNVAFALKDKDECKCKEFKEICGKDGGKKLKDFVDKMTDDAIIYTGPEFDPSEAKGCPLIGVWKEQDVTFYCIKYGIEDEKC